MKDPIRILLADDHEIFRDGFKFMLKKNQEIKVIGEAANGKILVEKAIQLKPDVIVTDIQMPVLDGIQATAELAHRLPGIGIIALTMSNEETQIVKMLEAGAKGYILKEAPKTEVIAAINAVYQDDNYYSKSTDQKLARRIVESTFNPVKLPIHPEFTEHDIAVIRLICQENTYQQIAEQMNLSKRTVEWYAKRIIEKIDAKNQAGIIVYAIRHHIFE